MSASFLDTVVAPSQTPMLPEWSIVCVVHNQAQDLMRWMRQAMSAKSDNWEMIIADAASNDGTRELALAVSAMDPRIRVLPRSRDHWLNILRHATERTLGDFILVQFPGTELPDLDVLTSQSFDRQGDIVDLRQIGGCAWPACRRGYWMQSAIDAASHQLPEQISYILAGEGARVVHCSPVQKQIS